MTMVQTTRPQISRLNQNSAISVVKWRSRLPSSAKAAPNEATEVDLLLT